MIVNKASDIVGGATIDRVSTRGGRFHVVRTGPKQRGEQLGEVEEKVATATAIFSFETSIPTNFVVPFTLLAPFACSSAPVRSHVC